MAASTRRRSASSRATTSMCRAVDEFFVCGPGTMGEDVPRVLGELGAQGRIHVEHFAPVASAACRAPAPAGMAAAAGRRGRRADADVTVVMDGRRRSFSMPRAAR